MRPETSDPFLASVPFLYALKVASKKIVNKQYVVQKDIKKQEANKVTQK